MFQVGQPQTVTQQLSQCAFDLIITLVTLPASDGVNTEQLLSGVSTNASPLTLREKLVRSILHTYSKDIP